MPNLKRNLSAEKIDLIVENVKSSLSLEELYVTKDEAEVYRKYLKGELAEEEVLKLFHNKGGGEN